MADDEVTPLTTTTTNYGFVKPDVGASDDVWGGLLNADLDSIDSAVHGVQISVPAASSSSPLMDGTAAVGTGTTFARADHVHPTDTSRYAASNPSGYQTAVQVTAALPVASSTAPVMDGIAAVGTGTTFARADHVHPTDVHAIGDNRIINGNFAINQRAYVSGTALATTVYGHDRWKAGPSGCTYTFTAALPDTTITITANTLTQIIEAGMIEGGVYTLSWTGTAQARVYQGAPTGSYAASPIVTASLTAGTNTIVEFNTGTVVRAKFEIGSIATPFNRQSLTKSLADCQRYYQTGIILMGSYGAVSELVYSTYSLKTTMRASPTATPTTITSANCSALTVSANTGTSTQELALTATVTTLGAFTAQASFTASAEL